MAEGEANGDRGIWSELARGDAALLERMTAGQAPVQVTFDAGRISVTFDTSLMTKRRKLFGNNQVLLGWPARLVIRERRRSERVTVPNSVSIPTRLIRADGLPAQDGDLPLTLLDLSATGASLLCPATAPPIKLQPRERLEICMLLRGAEHWIHACHRHTKVMPDGRARIGIEFAPDTRIDPRTHDLLLDTIETLKADQIRASLGAALRQKEHCIS